MNNNCIVVLGMSKCLSDGLHGLAAVVLLAIEIFPNRYAARKKKCCPRLAVTENNKNATRHSLHNSARHVTYLLA